MTEYRHYRIGDFRPVAEPGWRVVVWDEDYQTQTFQLAGWAHVEMVTTSSKSAPPPHAAWTSHGWQAAWVAHVGVDLLTETTSVSDDWGPCTAMALAPGVELTDDDRSYKEGHLETAIEDYKIEAAS